MLKRFRVSQLISWRRLLSVYFLHHPFRLSPARWLCAALLPLCPRLTSPVSLIVKVPVGLMLKHAFPPPAWSGIGIPLLLNVWKRKDVLIYSSMLDEATANL